MLQLQWTSFTAAIIAALVVGWLLSRFFLKTDGMDRSSLRNQLDELKKEHQTYQINVTEHFGRTTELIQELNSNYAKIQDHINHGAEEFVKPEYRLESARNGESAIEDLAPSAEKSDSNLGPRDYATKEANEEGTLSESYGLKRKATLEAEIEDPTKI